MTFFDIHWGEKPWEKHFGKEHFCPSLIPPFFTETLVVPLHKDILCIATFVQVITTIMHCTATANLQLPLTYLYALFSVSRCDQIGAPSSATLRPNIRTRNKSLWHTCQTHAMKKTVPKNMRLDGQSWFSVNEQWFFARATDIFYPRVHATTIWRWRPPC